MVLLASQQFRFAFFVPALCFLGISIVIDFFDKIIFMLLEFALFCIYAQKLQNYVFLLKIYQFLLSPVFVDFIFTEKCM